MVKGRPSIYNQILADIICERISAAESLRSICADKSLPDKSTVLRWKYKYKEFSDQYARAKISSADSDQDLLEDIGDEAIKAVRMANPDKANALVSAYRLKSDNIKWNMGKKNPKKYGDKLALEVEETQMTDEQRIQRIAALQSKLNGSE